MSDLQSYVDVPTLIFLSVSFAIVSGRIILIIKKVSKTPQDQFKNKVVKMTALAFTASYTLRAIFITLSAWFHQSFGGSAKSREFFGTWFGYILFYLNQNLLFDLLTIIIQAYFNFMHLKELDAEKA
jgi:hypothetical protein